MNACWHEEILDIPLKLKLYVRRDSIGLLKGTQPWIFIGRTEAGAEALAPDAENRLIGKDAKAGKDWGQEEKGTTEDEMVGWPNSIDTDLSKLGEIVKAGEAWSAAVHGVAKSWTWLRDWIAKVVQWVKNLPAMQDTQEMWAVIPGSGRSPGGRHSDPLWYSWPGDSHGQRCWWVTVIELHRIRHNWSD